MQNLIWGSSFEAFQKWTLIWPKNNGILDVVCWKMTKNKIFHKNTSSKYLKNWHIILCNDQLVDNLEVCISFLCANLNECFHSLVLLIHDHISFQPTSKYIWSPELQTLFPLYCRVNSPNYWPSNIGRLMTFDLECVHVQTFYQFDVLWHTFQDWNQVCIGNFRKWNSF